VATDRERMDGHNGLLLAPQVDHLFNDGWITFTDAGGLLISKHLDAAVWKAWKLVATVKRTKFTNRQKSYLAYPSMAG